jgi:hypothetical protein
MRGFSESLENVVTRIEPSVENIANFEDHWMNSEG